MDVALNTKMRFVTPKKGRAPERRTAKMKISYTFANGENSEVEVNEEIGTFILDSRREEDNLGRKERYHCYVKRAIFL